MSESDSDTIMQLGIEAAREGDREQARNLFSLVTRQEPENSQAWLWLAGVAETQDERRGALERVLEIDPSNEMARKGLQAMGVTSSAAAAKTVSAETATTSTVTPVEPTPVSPPAQPDAALSDEELYANELDSAFGDDYEAVIAEAPPRRERPDEAETIGASSAAATAVDDESVRTTPRRTTSTYAARRAEVEQNRSRPLRLLLLLAALILIALLAFFLLNRPGQQVAGTPTSTAQGTAEATSAAATGATAEATAATSGEATSASGETAATAEGGSTPEAGGEATAEPATEATAEPTTPPVDLNSVDVTQASPAPVDVGTTLEANGLTYSFPNICAGSCGVAIGNQVGSSTAQGTYVVVLVTLANTSGTAQTIPADFFVLKDAEGRVYTPDIQASNNYLIRGVNADRSISDELPADGLLYSIPLVFDVQHGATNLTLFTRGNTSQGWVVLNAAP